MQSKEGFIMSNLSESERKRLVELEKDMDFRGDSGFFAGAEALAEIRAAVSPSDEALAEQHANDWWDKAESTATTREYVILKKATLFGLQKGRELERERCAKITRKAQKEWEEPAWILAQAFLTLNAKYEAEFKGRTK